MHHKREQMPKVRLVPHPQTPPVLALSPARKRQEISRTKAIVPLTHTSLASHFWDIGKQCRPRSDAADRGQTQNAASDQGLHCLLTGISI